MDKSGTGCVQEEVIQTEERRRYGFLVWEGWTIFPLVKEGEAVPTL